MLDYNLHFSISINLFTSALFLPSKERNSDRQTMHAIKNQDRFRKICSKALPSLFSIKILRTFIRVKYFHVLCIWKEENSF